MGYRALFGIFALFPVLAVGLHGLLILVAKNPRRGYS
jgi:hypothetical protein